MTQRAEVQRRYSEFCDALQKLVLDYADALAPDVDENGEACVCGMDCECAPPTALAAPEWLLVVNYMDMDEGGCFMTGVSPDTMLNSHVLGLLEYYKKSRGW